MYFHSYIMAGGYINRKVWHTGLPGWNFYLIVQKLLEE